MREGFPGRGASSKRSSALNSSKSIPWSPTHRSRHRRTVSTFTSSYLAILAFEYPFDAYKIICARNTFCCSLLCRLVIFVNSSLSFSLRTTLVAGLGMRFFLGSVFPPILSWIHFNRNVLVRAHPQKFLVSEIVDWQFAVEGKRHLFHVASEQDIDAVEYFLLLCDRLAHALGKQVSEFKEYQKAVKTIKEAKKQVSSEVERLKQDDEYAWVRELETTGLMQALRQCVPLLGPLLDIQTIAGAVKGGIDMGLQVTQQQLGQLARKLREKMGQKLDDSLDPSLRIGFALGEDLANWSRNFPLLIFFDTYEEVDEADELLRLVMSAAGTRVGWILAGRDNLWAGIGQRRRTQSKSYGYKEIATPGRALAVDFNAGGVGAFTPT